MWSTLIKLKVSYRAWLCTLVLPYYRRRLRSRSGDSRSSCSKWKRVILCDLPTSDGVNVAKELGLSCHFSPTNVTSEDDVDAALDLAESIFGESLNTAVNRAGIALAIKTLSKKGINQLYQFQQTINSQKCRTWCFIINTASIAAYDGQIGQDAYAASKSAIVGMRLTLSRDLSSFGIRVNTIAPGTTTTLVQEWTITNGNPCVVGLFMTPLLAGLPEKMQKELGNSVPFSNRLGKPEEFAHLVHAIIDNKMVNGETILLDGGCTSNAAKGYFAVLGQANHIRSVDCK
ncbi:hypothetical protein PsorP6_009640 [Peronosclerospora sorghi]|uniref:Uncharacterized protein n=1 Tax=Peronosclerospora sorghi TaxID=230839 RepID=A0ACC0VY77_9STRA|nr:hypothetical protein PsorP6_009640 [Peronosclerospora sorghi]